jgi:hypothetical protein
MSLCQPDCEIGSVAVPRCAAGRLSMVQYSLISTQLIQAASSSI